MTPEKKWDGKAKGSITGNYIAIKIISLFGIFPAYFVVLMAALRYTLFDQIAIKALKIFRKQIGMKSTNLFQLHKHFRSFGFGLVDRFAFLALKNPGISYSYINEKSISCILDQGKGAILLSAHIGNWEIAGNLLKDRIDTCIHAVMVDNEQAGIKKVFQEAIDNRRFNIIPFSEDGLAMMLPIQKALGKNEIVCMLGDRVAGQSGVEMPFFGKSAQFPAGPFQIAAITKATILPVFIVKDGLTHYTLKAFDPICFDNVTRKNRQDKIKEAMGKYIKCLESISREYPYQWFNFFDIWASKEDNIKNSG